jgi:bifunctional non-homologous end joining protein LigD
MPARSQWTDRRQFQDTAMQCASAPSSAPRRDENAVRFADSRTDTYLNYMPMAYELSLATAGKQVPSGPDWIHEVKHDGYRMLVIRENERVRLFSKNGSDWTRRYPWIAEAALENRQKHFVIDGEAVVLGVDGISDFNALHFRKHDHEVYTPSTFSRWAATTCGLCPYTCARRTWSSLARGPDGITVAPFERGEIGPDLFRAACRMGLEGLVSKQRERPYQAGRSRHSVKVKNRQHPAMRYGLSRHQNSG